MNWGDLINKAESAGGGDPIPANDYTVVVASAEAKSSSTGKPMLKVKARVQGGPFDGRVLWTNMTLSVENDNAVAIFMRQLGSFGLGKEYFAQNPSFEQVAQALVGRSAVFVVKVGTYQGRPKNDVDDVKPGSPGGVPAPQAGIPQVPTSPAPTIPQVPTAGYGATTLPAPAPAPVPQPPAPEPAPAPQPVPEIPSTPAPSAPPF